MTTSYGTALSMIALLCASCVDGKESCRANLDCALGEACVAGICTANPDDCQNVGTFDEIWSGPLPGSESVVVVEAHVTVDSRGATHVCWYGQDDAGGLVSYYSHQTAADVFEVSPLETVDGTQLQCGAIAVDEDGTPFVFSRHPIAVASRGPSGWAAVPLTGLDGPEATGAVSSPNAAVALTPDGNGGVLVALSIGLLVSNQAVYLAHLQGEELTVYANGWSESGDYGPIGHAPQALVKSGGEIRVLIGDTSASTITLTDASYSLLDTIDGYFARTAASADRSVARTAYFDKNFVLRVADATADELAPIAELGAMLVSSSGDGRVPWEIAVDPAGTAHLLVEDLSQGPSALVYRTASADGAASEPMIVTMSSDGDLPGAQRYSLGADLCGRATTAVLEGNEETGVVDLVVREGR